MEKKENILITGGHFMIKDRKPNLNVGTTKSFKLAIKEYLKFNEKLKNVKLGILINDIGINCNTVECCIKKQEFNKKKFILPEEYLKILKENEINKDNLIIFWEKHLRNRGKKELLRQLKKRIDIKLLNGNYWLIKKSKRFLLSRERTKDKYGNAACPLIMAAFQMEQEKLGFKNSLNFYYVGNDNTLNIPDPFVINKGIEVAKTFGSKIAIKNVYLK